MSKITLNTSINSFSCSGHTFLTIWCPVVSFHFILTFWNLYFPVWVACRVCLFSLPQTLCLIPCSKPSGSYLLKAVYKHKSEWPGLRHRHELTKLSCEVTWGIHLIAVKLQCFPGFLKAIFLRRFFVAVRKWILNLFFRQFNSFFLLFHH